MASIQLFIFYKAVDFNVVILQEIWEDLSWSYTKHRMHEALKEQFDIHIKLITYEEYLSIKTGQITSFQVNKLHLQTPESRASCLILLNWGRGHNIFLFLKMKSNKNAPLLTSVHWGILLPQSYLLCNDYELTWLTVAIITCDSSCCCSAKVTQSYFNSYKKKPSKTTDYTNKITQSLKDRIKPRPYTYTFIQFIKILIVLWALGPSDL